MPDLDCQLGVGYLKVNHVPAAFSSQRCKTV